MFRLAIIFYYFWSKDPDEFYYHCTTYCLYPLNPAQIVVRPHLLVQYSGSWNFLPSTGPTEYEVKSMMSSGNCDKRLGV
jgi:hypothetical protein